MSAFDSENSVSLIGRLGKDPELRYTPNGTAVCTFSLATSRSYKTDEEWKEKVAWHTITTWNKQAEACAQHLKKGQKARIVGYLDYGSYEKDGVKIPTCKVIAERVMFLDKPGGTGSANPDATDIDDDTPF